MAKTTVTNITDDLDGTANAEEVSFSFGGVDYTIDLAKKNRSAMEKALKPYLEAATRQTRRSGRKKAVSSSRQDLGAVREWARGQGIEVSNRGRIPASVLEQYDAAR